MEEPGTKGDNMNDGMSAAAIVFMTVSFVLVLALNIFCFGRLFFGGDKKKQ